MDFTLTNEQMVEYVARCVDNLNKEYDEKKFVFEVTHMDYPDMTIKINLKKTNLTTTYQLTFTKNYVFCRYGNIDTDMQEIYIKFMYEIFGEDYLRELEICKRFEVDERKKSATNDYHNRLNALDNQLIDYLILLNNIRENSLNT